MVVVVVVAPMAWFQVETHCFFFPLARGGQFFMSLLAYYRHCLELKGWILGVGNCCQELAG